MNEVILTLKRERLLMRVTYQPLLLRFSLGLRMPMPLLHLPILVVKRQLILLCHASTR